MSEIKLTRRYPDSKPEDITDAYMRGVAAGMEIANSQTVRRIDAFERRIDRLEGMLDGMGKGAASRIEAIEGRIEALEKRCGKIAAFSYGDNDSRIKDHEQRVERMERKLNHKGGTE